MCSSNCGMQKLEIGFCALDSYKIEHLFINIFRALNYYKLQL